MSSCPFEKRRSMSFCDSSIYTGSHAVTHEIFLARNFVSFGFAHPALPYYENLCMSEGVEVAYDDCYK
jgi:hypothetical protein